MARTTLDLDDQLLETLRSLAKRERRTIGAIVSECVAASLARRPSEAEPFEWISTDLGLKIDIDDKDALARALGDQ